MSISTTVGVALVVIFVIIVTLYLVNKADKRRKMQQDVANTAKKAEAAANRAAWDRWRKK
jgi:uncharacterized membrane protein